MSRITLSITALKALNDSQPLFQLTVNTLTRRPVFYFLEREERDRVAMLAAAHPATVCVCRDWTVQEVREAFDAWDRLHGVGPFQASA